MPTAATSDNELVRDILLALLSSLAKQEAKRMGERVRAGMARAKAQGKRLGRPRIDADTESAIRAALKAKHRVGTRKIAARIGCGVGTVQRIQRELVE